MSNRSPFVGFRIRARKLRPGEECFFCMWSLAGESPQSVLAFVYFMGHQDEATADGRSLCDDCMAMLLRVTERITAAQGGVIHDLNDKKGRQA